MKVLFHFMYTCTHSGVYVYVHTQVFACAYLWGQNVECMGVINTVFRECFPPEWVEGGRHGVRVWRLYSIYVDILQNHINIC